MNETGRVPGRDPPGTLASVSLNFFYKGGGGGSGVAKKNFFYITYKFSSYLTGNTTHLYSVARYSDH
jgi:hypothetical protein